MPSRAAASPMLTSPQDPLQSQDVYTCTSNTLATVPRRRPGGMQRRARWRVVACAAAAQLAVQHACPPRARAPAGPTVLGPLAGPRSAREALAGPGQALVARLRPQGWGQRGRHVALAVRARPAHGPVAAAQQDAGGRRHAQGGTAPFCPSATAAAVVQGRRSPLARGRGRAKQTLAHVVRPLRERVALLGLRRPRRRRDRGFDRVRVLGARSTAAWPWSRPVVNRGPKPAPPGAPTGPSARAAATQGRWTSSPWPSAPEGQAPCDRAVGGHPHRRQPVVSYLSCLFENFRH